MSAHEHHHNHISGDQQIKTVGNLENLQQLVTNTFAAPPTTTNPFLHHHDHEHSLSDQDHGSMKMWFHGGCDEVILFDFWRIESCIGLITSCLLIFAMAALYEGLKWFRIYFQMWTSNGSAGNSGGLSCCAVTMKGVNGGTGRGVEDALIQKSLSGGCEGGCAPPTHLSGGIGPGATGTLTNEQVYAPTVLAPIRGTGGQPMNRFTWLMSYANRNLTASQCKLIETFLYCVQLLLAYWLMLVAMTFNIYLTAAVVFGAGLGHWFATNVKCAPSRKCVCNEQADNFASDACH